MITSYAYNPIPNDIFLMYIFPQTHLFKMTKQFFLLLFFLHNKLKKGNIAEV